VAGQLALGHYTHEKNPVLCAAALATIRFIEENNLLEKATSLGRYALDRVRTMMAAYPVIGDVRGLGLLLGLELVQDRATKERAFDEAEQVMYSALSKGLSFKLTMGNVISLTPPLTISKQELDTAFDILEACLAEVA
jgi:4-aminobutyrate aminotransferase